MSDPLVVIIILNWNNTSETINCIESVNSLKYSNFKVIVIDNASFPNPIEQLHKEYPDIEIIQNKKNYGYTGGNNIGIKRALELGAKFIWLLNNDAIVEENCLDALIREATNDPQIGLVSPVICAVDNKDYLIYCGSFIDTSNQKRESTNNLEMLYEWRLSKSKRIMLWGTALLLSRTLVERIGLLDDNFFAYYEDMDYSLRSINAGFKDLIVVNAKIFHQNMNAGLRKPHYYYYMTRNEYYFWMKHLPKKNKIKFARKYWANVIKQAAEYRNSDLWSIQEAILSGAWSAIVGREGSWDEREKMPYFLSKCLLWHPYFLSKVLNWPFDYIT